MAELRFSQMPSLRFFHHVVLLHRVTLTPTLQLVLPQPRKELPHDLDLQAHPP
jgi:hypothetical protein